MLATVVVQDIESQQLLYSQGDVDRRYSPCSTFKVVLAAIGYDAGILLDDQTPLWDFQEGFTDFLPVWRESQTPRSWIANSCVWYSQLLVKQLDLQEYVTLLDYGNGDALAQDCWLSSSLEISPREQVEFVTKLVREELPLSKEAQRRAKELLYSGEGDLFGKSGSDCRTIGWYVGWQGGRSFACILEGKDASGALAKRYIKDVKIDGLSRN
ncbi:MAG: hypothetical protein K0U13_05045 [Chlamydiae bacterium]|nr:hypothetical protein [Chlamydiota bacterium]